MSRIASAVALIVVFAITSPAVAGSHLDAFFGAYVGSGKAERLRDGVIENRDLDVTIKPYKSNGFEMTWITVIRDADGARTGAGVRRREVEEQFIPFDNQDGVYVLAPKGGLFKKAELPNPLRGEPMRWAAIDGKTLTIYSMAISPDGSSELQIYHRTLTERGLAVAFLRMQDEETRLRFTGELVRTE